MIFHFNTLIVLEDNILFVGTVPFILEPTELLDIDFLTVRLFMYMHSMHFQLFSSLEGNKLLIKTIFFHTDVMSHLEMNFEVKVVLVVAVPILRTADIADDVL